MSRRPLNYVSTMRQPDPEYGMPLEHRGISGNTHGIIPGNKWESTWIACESRVVNVTIPIKHVIRVYNYI